MAVWWLLGVGFWFSGRVEADSEGCCRCWVPGCVMGVGLGFLSPLAISGVIAGRGLVVGVGGCSPSGFSSSLSKLLGWRRFVSD